MIEFRYVVHSDVDENNIFAEFEREPEAVKYAKGFSKDDKVYVEEVTVETDEDGEVIRELDKEVIWKPEEEVELEEPFAINNWEEIEYAKPDSLVKEPTVKEMHETLEENEELVECQECFELFPKADCIKIEYGYLCPTCGKLHITPVAPELIDHDVLDLEFPEVREYDDGDEDEFVEPVAVDQTVEQEVSAPTIENPVTEFENIPVSFVGEPISDSDDSSDDDSSDGLVEDYTGNPEIRTTHLEYEDTNPTDGKAVLPDNITKKEDDHCEKNPVVNHDADDKGALKESLSEFAKRVYDIDLDESLDSILLEGPFDAIKRGLSNLVNEPAIKKKYDGNGGGYQIIVQDKSGWHTDSPEKFGGTDLIGSFDEAKEKAKKLSTLTNKGIIRAAIRSVDGKKTLTTYQNGKQDVSNLKDVNKQNKQDAKDTAVAKDIGWEQQERTSKKDAEVKSEEEIEQENYVKKVLANLRDMERGNETFNIKDFNERKLKDYIKVAEAAGKFVNTLTDLKAELDSRNKPAEEPKTEEKPAEEKPEYTTGGAGQAEDTANYSTENPAEETKPSKADVSRSNLALGNKNTKIRTVLKKLGITDETKLSKENITTIRKYLFGEGLSEKALAIHKRALKEAAADIPFDSDVKVGSKIRIGHLEGEDNSYDGKEGEVQHIDSIGQLHGTWGGLAVIPGVDEFEVISESLKEDIEDITDPYEAGLMLQRFLASTYNVTFGSNTYFDGECFKIVVIGQQEGYDFADIINDWKWDNNVYVDFSFDFYDDHVDIYVTAQEYDDEQECDDDGECDESLKEGIMAEGALEAELDAYAATLGRQEESLEATVDQDLADDRTPVQEEPKEYEEPLSATEMRKHEAGIKEDIGMKIYHYVTDPSKIEGDIQAPSKEEARKMIENELAEEGIYVGDEIIDLEEIGEVEDYIDYKHSYCHVLEPKLKRLWHLAFTEKKQPGYLKAVILSELKHAADLRHTEKEREFVKNVLDMDSASDIYYYVLNSVNKAKETEIAVDEKGEPLELEEDYDEKFTTEEQEEYGIDEDGMSVDGWDEWVRCQWCGEPNVKSDCRYELNMGWICDRCQAALYSRGAKGTWVDDPDELDLD